MIPVAPLLLFSLLVPYLLGCAAHQAEFSKNPAEIEPSTLLPPSGYFPIGLVTVQQVRVCDSYGARTEFEVAVSMLRSQAAELGAEYFPIFNHGREDSKGFCFGSAFTISGITYMKKPTTALITQRERPSTDQRWRLSEAETHELSKSINAGIVSTFAGKNADAIAAFGKAIRILPEAEIYALLAESYLRIGARASAVSAFNEALRINPTLPLATSRIIRLLSDEH